MKTIEAAIIFPFTLMLMVAILFLAFDLHDRVLCKSASYKFLVRNSSVSINYSQSDNNDISLLKNYIDKFSLSEKDFDVTLAENSIEIRSTDYSCTVKYEHFDKCYLLRKCAVAVELADSLLQTNEGD